jgi:hypothetical protein
MRMPRNGLLASLLLASLACSSSSSDRASDLNEKLTISPATAMVTAGQAIQFTASSPWGGAVAWSVIPSGCGAFAQDGLFTAASAPGTCTVVARLQSDIRYVASAAVTVVPALPSDFWVGLVQASGGRSASADGQVQNVSVVGEPTRALLGADPTGALTDRPGFLPSGSIYSP